MSSLNRIYTQSQMTSFTVETPAIATPSEAVQNEQPAVGGAFVLVRNEQTAAVELLK